jgi:hypothetical protein
MEFFMSKGKLVLMGMTALLLSFALILAACPTDGDGDGGDGGEQLPASSGANELSGKTYFDFDDKIVFAADGTYKVSSVKNDEDHDPVLEGGKYTYTETEIGAYSWNATAKTVTTKPEKIAVYGENGYGALQNTAGYRAEGEAWLNAYKEEMGEADFNAELAEMGFSSVAAYLDDYVADSFKNVTRNYAFSKDNKALFLDEQLPANKGTNELSGQTFTRSSNNSSEKYVFTGTDCTYTYGGGDDYTQTYTYAYDSEAKRVYLKTPTTDRADTYEKQIANNNNNTGYFATADEYNAAQVNSRYRWINQYRYDVTAKTLDWF